MLDEQQCLLLGAGTPHRLSFEHPGLCGASWLMDVFKLHDPVWKVWVSGPKSGWIVELAAAIEMCCVGVGSELEARRVLKSLPSEVEIHESRIEEFEKYFLTQTTFHHERIIGDCLMKNRPVWVTLKSHDANPETYWDMAHQLLMDRRFVKALDDCVIQLKDGGVITFDKEPTNG